MLKWTGLYLNFSMNAHLNATWNTCPIPTLPFPPFFCPLPLQAFYFLFSNGRTCVVLFGTSPGNERDATRNRQEEPTRCFMSMRSSYMMEDCQRTPQRKKEAHDEHSAVPLNLPGLCNVRWWMPAHAALGRLSPEVPFMYGLPPGECVRGEGAPV